MRALLFLPVFAGFAFTAAAQPLLQQPAAPPQADRTHRDTTPFIPTPEQEGYLDGLKTAWRGVAQLKDGIAQVARQAGAHDSTMLRQAGHRLSGLCQAAHGFLATGRASMNANVFADERKKVARDLALSVDSLRTASKNCEHTASHDPSHTALDLVIHIRAAEGALAGFRTSIGLPNRTAQATPASSTQAVPPPKPQR